MTQTPDPRVVPSVVVPTVVVPEPEPRLDEDKLEEAAERADITKDDERSSEDRS